MYPCTARPATDTTKYESQTPAVLAVALSNLSGPRLLTGVDADGKLDDGKDAVDEVADVKDKAELVSSMVVCDRAVVVGQEDQGVGVFDELGAASVDAEGALELSVDED